MQSGIAFVAGLTGSLNPRAFNCLIFSKAISPTADVCLVVTEKRLTDRVGVWPRVADREHAWIRRPIA